MVNKTLKGQELADYIKKNPDAKIKITKGASELAKMLPAPEPEKKRGFLGNLVKGITDPFINTGRGGAELLNQALGGEKGKFLSEEEMRDPFGFALKNAAGVGSFLVPGGAGIKGALTLGAVSGGLGGLSQSDLSDPSNIVKNVVTGGVLGGATGGVLNKLFGKAGNKAVSEVADQADNQAGILAKIQGKGKDIERGLTGIKTPISPTGALEVDQLADDFINKTTARGFKPNAEGMGAATKQARQELGRVLPNQSNLIDSTNVLDDLNDLMAREGIRLDKAANSDIIGSVFKKIDLAEGNPQKIANLIDELDNQLGAAYKARSSGMRALSPSEKINLQVRESLSRNLKNTIPEAAPLYNELSLYNTVSKDVIKNAEKSGSISAPLLTNIKIPTLGVDTAAKNMAAKTLQGKIPGLNTVRKVASLGSSVPAQRIVRTGMSTSGTQLANMEQPTAPIQEELANAIQNEPANPEIERIMNEMQALKNNFIIESIRAGSDPNEAMATAESLFGGTTGGQPVDRTEKQAQFYNAAQSARNALGLLESGQADTGKLQAVESKIGNFLGTTGASQVDYKSNLALARGLAMNALAGANISPSEAARIADSIPSEADEPNIARQKLASFIQQMESFSNG